MQFLNVHLIYNSFTREDIKIFYPQMAEKKCGTQIRNQVTKNHSNRETGAFRNQTHDFQW